MEDIIYASVTDLAQAIQAKEVSSVEVVLRLDGDYSDIKRYF